MVNKQSHPNQTYRIVLSGLLALVFLSPFVVTSQLRDYANLPQSIFIQEGVLLLFLLWFVRSALSGKSVLLVPFAVLPALAWLGWCYLSLTWAKNSCDGLEQAVHMTACILAGFLATQIFSGPQEIRSLLIAITLSATGTSLLGLLQFLLGMNLIEQGIAPAATFVNKNMAAEHILIGLPCCFTLWVSGRNRSSYAWMLCLLLMLTYLFDTYTKSAWLACLAMATFCILWILAKEYRSGTSVLFPKKKWLAFLIVIPLWLGLICLTPEGFQWPGNKISSSLATVFLPESAISTEDESGSSDMQKMPDTDLASLNQRRENSIEVRLRTWRTALAIFKDHPILGVGLGSFNTFHMKYQAKVCPEPLINLHRSIGYAHNDLLQVIVETGAVGGILFIIFPLYIGAHCLMVLRSGSPYARPLAWCVLATWLGTAVDSCFSFPLERAIPPLLISVLSGAALNLKSGGRSLPRYSFTIHPAIGWSLAGLLLLSGLGSSKLQYQRALADHYVRLEMGALRKKQWEGVILWGEKAVQRAPWRLDAPRYLGRAYLALNRHKEAEEIFESIMRTNPWDPYVLHFMAVSAFDQKRYDESLALFDRVLEILPNEPETMVKKGCIYGLQKRFDEARECLSIGSSAWPDDPNMQFNVGLALLNLKEYARARDCFTRSVQIKPNWADAERHLGYVLFFQTGDKEEGIKHLRRAFELDPKGPHAEQLRRLLDQEDSSR